MALGYAAAQPYTPLSQDPNLLLALMIQRAQAKKPPSGGGSLVDKALELTGAKTAADAAGASSIGDVASSLPDFSYSPPAFSFGADAAAPGGFNLAGEVPAGLTSEGGFSGMAPTAPGAFDMAGIGSAGNAILPAAGLAGAYDLFKNKRTGARGALQGAASGAAIGSYFGPVGIGVGAGIGGLAGLANRWGDKDAYKTEWKRKKALYDQGLITAQQLGSEPTSGRSKAELVAEAQANGGNVKFAQSRNEADLMPGDIAGYASVLGEAQKRGVDPAKLAEQALAAKAVREHHGTIDVDWSKVAQPGSPTAPKLLAAPNATNTAMIPRVPITNQRKINPATARD